jgi:hypothetical protein
LAGVFLEGHCADYQDPHHREHYSDPLPPVESEPPHGGTLARMRHRGLSDQDLGFTTLMMLVIAPVT